MRGRSFGRDRHGAVAVLTALGLTVLMAAAAVGIDLGSMVLARRKAQGAVDLAATLAAANPAKADALARRSLADNGYASALITVQPGSYSADAKVSLDARFSADSALASAVRVAMTTSTPTFFAPALGLNREVDITVRGTAASAQFAAFTVGSGLASLNPGVANAILTAMLGKPVSLSVMDYNAILSTRVDAFRFLDALAPSLALQAGSYQDIVRSTATIEQVVLALKATADGTANGAVAASALRQIASGLRSGMPIRVDQIVDLGDAGTLNPGAGSRGPTIDLMNTLSDAVVIANGQRQVSVNIGASIPGVTGTKLTLAIGERRQSSGYVRPGSAAATVTTAQVRLLIEADITLPLNLGSLTLPIYVQAAQAKATLRSTTCPWSDQGQRQVVLDAQPGLADLAVATIPKASIDPTAATPSFSQPATLLRVAPSLVVSGRSSLSIGSTYAQSVTFGEDDIARHTVKTVSSNGLTQSAVTSLIQNLDLSVSGIGILTPGLLTGTVATVLGTVAPALDGVLNSTLRTLGLRLGNADVTVDGTRCDQAVLVQ
ncbi:TadG family pilus assembly protein [Methylobacterium sp. Leaf466]|uniref:TadG family pilus assembly protein n=1 Tax=Methylobacterium sp. Leaf466 TaxID=1736386 RepID=UPI0006FA427B|nr:TadG family pilus assembly protein [Methylobacterium sp. Leaf466]KQT77888.1 hypothetical protein ASG59_11255 [Methylobacterium sp. Leaf466]